MKEEKTRTNNEYLNTPNKKDRVLKRIKDILDSDRFFIMVCALGDEDTMKDRVMMVERISGKELLGTISYMLEKTQKESKELV